MFFSLKISSSDVVMCLMVDGCCSRVDRFTCAEVLFNGTFFSRQTHSLITDRLLIYNVKGCNETINHEFYVVITWFVTHTIRAHEMCTCNDRTSKIKFDIVSLYKNSLFVTVFLIWIVVLYFYVWVDAMRTLYEINTVQIVEENVWNVLNHSKTFHLWCEDDVKTFRRKYCWGYK